MSLPTIKAAIETGNVVMVAKSYCPFCKKAKAILEEYGINASKYTIFDIDLDTPDMAEIQAYMGEVTGAKSVPRVFIGGKFVGGADGVTELHTSGKLRELLTGIGAC